MAPCVFLPSPFPFYPKQLLIHEQKSEVTLAILSSYSTDSNWVYDFFLPSTPIVLVNQGEDGNTGVKELAPNFVLAKPFLRGGRGCMHIKVRLCTSTFVRGRSKLTGLFSHA